MIKIPAEASVKTDHGRGDVGMLTLAGYRTSITRAPNCERRSGRSEASETMPGIAR